MATITIAGSCYIVTSKLSMADLELAKKHRPKALKIMDAETKETVFAIGTGGNNVTDYGINFGGASNDESKLATVTMPIPSDEEDAMAYVTEKAGAAVINLNRLEPIIEKALEEIKAERKTVTDNIKVVI